MKKVMKLKCPENLEPAMVFNLECPEDSKRLIETLVSHWDLLENEDGSWTSCYVPELMQMTNEEWAEAEKLGEEMA